MALYITFNEAFTLTLFGFLFTFDDVLFIVTGDCSAFNQCTVYSKARLQS